MGVVIWKRHRAYFGTLVGKTSFGIAAENYARSGSPGDLQKLQYQAALRRRLQPSEMAPLDIVVNRVIETRGSLRDLAMLRALVRPRRAAAI